MDRARVIGKDGQLPWHLPADLRRFKALTMGHPIIMGRRTHESIGRPLPGRQNIVLTRQRAFQAPGCDCFGSLADAIQRLPAAAAPFVIGGAAVYAEALPVARMLYITQVDADVAGDVYFPDIDDHEWRQVSSEHHPADDKHAFDFRFLALERIGA